MEESAPIDYDVPPPNTPHVRHVSRGHLETSRELPRELCLWFVELAITYGEFYHLPHYNKMFDVGVIKFYNRYGAISIELQRIGVGTLKLRYREIYRI
ncbi:hypothetical protein SPFM20_00154 [Salmonella phage SPFM20]|nr:hypothetical protein SPFM20_00154 [Salmonella phage SPFM20]